MLVKFNPPPGSPPVELEGLGSTRVFHPMDQVWKKVTVQIDNFPLRNPYDRTKELEVKDEKTGEMRKVYRVNRVKRWVVDEEKTKQLKSKKLLPPSDTYEITSDEWILLQQGSMKGVGKWFEKVKTIAISNQQEAYQKQIDAIQAEREAEKAAMQKQIAELEAKMAKAMKDQEQFSVGESRRGR